MAHPGFEQLVERISDFVMIAYEGRIIYANPAVAEGLGYTREELLGKAPLELAHPDDRAGVRERIERALQGTLNESVNVRLLRSDGTYAPIVGVSFGVVVDGKQEAVLVGQDLRPQTDFRNLVDTLPSGILVHENGIIRYLNASGEKMLGVPAAALIGMSVLRFFPPEDRARQAAIIARNAATADAYYGGEQIVLRPDGRQAVINLSSIAVRFEGRPARLAAFTDETERHTAAASLQAAADEWQESFDAVDAPMLVVSGPEREIVRANRAALEKLGMPRKKLTELLDAEPWKTSVKLAQQAESSKAPVLDRVREESRVWLVSASPVREGRVILTLRDVSAVAELQETLRRAEAMAAMGSLVAGVAHEVRNPIFGMSATLDAMQQRFATDSQQEPFMRAMRRELDRINALMRDLLEYGRPPAVTLVPDALAPVVALAARSCLPVADMASVEVVNTVGPEAGNAAMDAGRLAQVFQNLIQNAIQHSPMAGKVRVEATREKGRVAVRVLDSGPGFRLEDVPRLFEPFFSRRRGGTGLGLSIVQRIVEQHGGQVEATNRPEGGACVTVYLPG